MLLLDGRERFPIHCICGIIIHKKTRLVFLPVKLQGKESLWKRGHCPHCEDTVIFAKKPQMQPGHLSSFPV